MQRNGFVQCIVSENLEPISYQTDLQWHRPLLSIHKQQNWPNCQSWLNELCQDFETVINEVPDNTTLKAGLNEIIQHMKVVQKVGKKLSFTKGTSGFTNKPATETTRGARHFASKEYQTVEVQEKYFR